MTTTEPVGDQRIERAGQPTIIRRRGKERTMEKTYGVLDNPSIQFERDLTENESIILQLALAEKNKSDAEAISDMQQFKGLHSDKKIDEDVLLLNKLRKKQAAKEDAEKSNDAKDIAKERAIIAEYLFYNFASDSKFFGKNSFVTKTNEFDDRTHHADSIVTWFDKEGNDTARLAFDVTISSNEQVLATKEDYIKSDIKSGKLTSLDYFDSQSTANYSLSQIPRVIIMLTPQNIIAMCNKAIEAIQSEDREFDSLADDPSIKKFIGIHIKEELSSQIERLQKNIGSDSPEKDLLFQQAILNTEAAVKQL